jgi:hypothetical protein
MKPPRSLRLVLAALACALIAGRALATWSVVVVNTRTREVCVASATCLANFDLKQALPVLAPELGGAAAQSFVDGSGQNRLRIWDGFHLGETPQQILDALALQDPGHQTRQYGIVSFSGPPVGFTGTGAGLAKFHVTGEVGELRYAVQGNVITGNEVVTAAEAALLATPGDLGQKVLAAMEAARALGGDGRCSCNPNSPTACGVPPPNFIKSAHVAFIVLARVGDIDGVCNPLSGCASGSYYLALNIIGGAGDPDPVLVMQSQYDDWRAALAGRPDQVLSRVRANAQALVADGRSSTTVTVELVDVEGVPLRHGGATLFANSMGGALLGATPFRDHGDGTYSVDLVAGTTPGTERWRISVDDGGPAVIVLQPDVEVRVDPPAELHAGYDVLSASHGGDVPFTLNLGASHVGRKYLLLASASGTQPGTVFRGTALPLNPDKLMRKVFDAAGTALLPNGLGVLDGAGRAVARFRPAPDEMGAWIGHRADWSAVLLDPSGPATSNAGFDVVP